MSPAVAAAAAAAAGAAAAAAGEGAVTFLCICDVSSCLNLEASSFWYWKDGCLQAAHSTSGA
jgi:hypothetical protein